MILQLLFTLSLLPVFDLLIHSDQSSHNLYEGDIVMDEWLFERLLLNETEFIIQNVAVQHQDRLWSNGSVPYRLSVDFSTLEKMSIENVMLEFSFLTCVTFHQRKLESKYIYIIKSDFSCKSYVGFQNKVQQVWLKDSCIERNTILHELMHVLGFYHEHSRHDRDDYIEVLEQNIIPSQLHNFKKNNNFNTTNFNTEYDYRSVLHYKPFDGSMNGNPTIRVRVAGREIKAEGLSEIDILKINRLYNCSKDKNDKTRQKDERQVSDKPTTMTEVPSSKNCDFTLTAENSWKHFHSHSNYEYNYGNNMFCKWKIQTPKSQRIKIKFQEFYLEDSINCAADRLEIFYGLACDHLTRKEVFCGQTIPSEIEYNMAVMELFFITDHNVTSKGFKISYKSTDVVGCNHMLIADNKPRNLYSHNGYNLYNYNNNAFCEWNIRAINSKIVFLVLGDSFELEYDATCSKDFMEFYNTIPDSNDDLPYSKSCGYYRDNALMSFNSLKDTAEVHFHTNSNVTGRGFHFVYFASPTGGFEKCGSMLIADDSVKYLNSHAAYLRENYGNNFSCFWRIRAGNGMHVKLMMPYFYLEYHTSCTYDYFEVYDGPDTSSEIFGRFCGNKVRRIFISSGQELFLVFRTDAATNDKGFWIAYFETL